MTLSDQQLTEIINTNPNKDLVAKAKKYAKDLRQHMYGEGLDQSLPAIKGFEKPSLNEMRVKYAKSNKDLFARLARPVDKVFSAMGGSIYYNLSDGQDKRAMALCSSLPGGYSVKKWLEFIWKPHFMDDPGGVVMIEVGDGEKIQTNVAYPTYKGSAGIFDYQPTGSNLEYIVFKLEKEEKKLYGIDVEIEVYRVVDDAFDYFVRKNGDIVTVMQDFTLKNLFGYVPAILNSDIVDPNNPHNRLSLFDDIIDLANEFLVKGSIKVTHDFLHGFPKYWEYADDCTDCNGTGSKGADKCGKCKGTGKSLMSKVSDAKLISYPQDKNDPIVTPNIAGYISPDKTYYEIAKADLADLEAAATHTIWGGSSNVKASGLNGTDSAQKSATQVMEEIKPEASRLSAISDSAEKRHKFIVDGIVKIAIDQNYSGSSINYGRRYLLDGPDELQAKYLDGKKNGLSVSLLDDILVELIEVKYSSDPIGKMMQLKLKDVEPFVHNTISDVKSWGISDQDFYEKLYFNDWLMTLNDAMIQSMTVEGLKGLLSTFASKKLSKKGIPEGAPV